MVVILFFLFLCYNLFRIEGDGMSGEYNSILKEKKIYTDPVHVDNHPMFKRAIKIGIFVALIILVVSYVIYFNTVLASESIFLNNITKFYTRYSVVYDNLGFDYDINNNYTFEGNVLVDNKEYDYSFIRDGNKFKKVLKNEVNNISYYYDDNLSYMKLSTLGNKYVQMDNQLYDIDYYSKKLDVVSSYFDVYINDMLLGSTVNEVANGFYNLDNYKKIFENIINGYNSISSDKYIKKVYLEDKRPIVEIDLVLNTDDVNNILGGKSNNLYVSDDVEISIIMKNDAVTNDICNIKIVINNKTNNRREVINYQEDELTFTDDQGLNDKLIFNRDGSDINLKYYKDNLLYSVLTGKLENNKYIYMYQVIDEIYNIKLSVDNNGNSYNYLLLSIMSLA